MLYAMRKAVIRETGNNQWICNRNLRPWIQLFTGNCSIFHVVENMGKDLGNFISKTSKMCGGRKKRKFRQLWSGNLECRAGFPAPTTVGRTLSERLPNTRPDKATWVDGYMKRNRHLKKENRVKYSKPLECGFQIEMKQINELLKT